MRELEAFIGIAQVAVGVDMQDAELPVAVTQGTDQSVRRRMVAPDEPHGLSGVEPPCGLRPDVGVHGPAAFVDATHLAYHIVVLGTAPAFEVGDHLLRIAAQALRLLQQRIVHIGRGDPPAPAAHGSRAASRLLSRHRAHGPSRRRTTPSRPTEPKPAPVRPFPARKEARNRFRYPHRPRRDRRRLVPYG